MSGKSNIETIPTLAAPNTREIDRMTEDMHRRAMILGRDERSLSGILTGRVEFILGFLTAVILLGISLI